MRRLGMVAALALALVGCHGGPATGSATPPGQTPAATPAEPSATVSGSPVELGCIGCGRVAGCRDALSGRLDADAKVTIYTGGWNGIAIEVAPLDTGALPAPPGVDPLEVVGVSWPAGYSGLRQADGEIALLDGAGRLVAMTGRSYQFEGEWVLGGSTGGPIFPRDFIMGFSVCDRSGSVTPG